MSQVGIAAREKQLIVVGVGASAGGLEALENMFDNIDPKCNMAFVVVQHLSPDFRSVMDELLARHTRLKIHRVENGMRVEPNSIYLIPPKKEMIISNGSLLLSDKDQGPQLSLPIDTFFRSLAQECKSSAVGVILSGTGSDGSLGVSKIHEAGGLVVVQSEESSKFNGMPRSAIETGMADLVVPPEKIGALLSRYGNSDSRTDFLAELNSMSDSEPLLQTVFASLQKEYGIDFSQYKPGTMLRRLNRRSQLANCKSVEEYAETVVSNSAERRALYEDLLIGVTRFFRDLEMFESLREALRDKLQNCWNDESMRVWVCGCSTGQEAYTVAMLLHNLLEDMNRQMTVKIFATDIDRDSLDFASKGLYDRSSIQDIPAEYLARYFIETLHGFQVIPEIRQMITFARHNSMRDAPFTSIHLITCRNLLIYLNNDAQQKVLSLLYFGLRSHGILFLGSSEHPNEIAADLGVIDASFKIYEKVGTAKLLSTRKPLVDVSGLVVPRSPIKNVLHCANPGMVSPELVNVYDLLLDDLVTAAILINQDGSVVQVFGNAARFLTIPSGRLSSKLVDLAGEDLQLAITGAVHRARKSHEPVCIPRLRVQVGEDEEQINLLAKSFKPRSGQSFVLVRFEPSEPSAIPFSSESSGLLIESAVEQIDELSIELTYTKENLNAAIEELEASNEELQATNEEMIAANEELQSTNEELHSVNEELYTVNAEYQKKIAELTKLNNDFDNLLSSTDIHTVFLDQELNIRFFTPKAIEIFNFCRDDIGRKFDSFTNKLCLKSLADDLQHVLVSASMIEREVIDQRGIAFLLRILPYMASGKACGVVISLLDISVRVEWELRLQNSNDRFERAIAATRDGIWDWPDVRSDTMWWSPMCYELLGYQQDEIPARYSSWLALIHPEDRERIVESTAPHKKNCFVELHRRFEYRMRHRSGEYRWFQHRALGMHNDAGVLYKMTGSVVDIQVRKALEDSLREQVRQRDDFLAILSHELRNPLGAVTNAIGLLDKQGHSQQQTDMALSIIREQTHHMSRLLDDLLDVSRVTHNKLEMRLAEFNMVDVANEVLASMKSRAELNGIELRFFPPIGPIHVVADPDRILQCQVNLVGNAIKFTPRGGFVDYSVRMEEGVACVEVKDSGVGMSKELSERIFEMFSQGENEPRVGDSGIGVGLALVRSIAELHGGTVNAHSDGLGKGSTFTLCIPLAPTVNNFEGAASQVKLIECPGTDGVKGKRVLIVDDIPEGRSMLAQLLALEGFEVVEAENGLEGFRLATTQTFDAALIDLGLPDISGHEVARRICKFDQSQSMKLIALTGYGQEKDLTESQTAGFHHHLTKPVDLKRLFKLI